MQSTQALNVAVITPRMLYVWRNECRYMLELLYTIMCLIYEVLMTLYDCYASEQNLQNDYDDWRRRAPWNNRESRG